MKILIILIMFIFTGCGEEKELLKQSENKINILMLKNNTLQKENEFLKKQQKELSVNDTEKDKIIHNINTKVEEKKKKVHDLELQLKDAQYKINATDKKQIEKDISKEYIIYLGFLGAFLLMSLLFNIHSNKKYKDKIGKLKFSFEKNQERIKDLEVQLIEAKKEKEKFASQLNTTEQSKIVELLNGYKERRLYELKEVCKNTGIDR